MRLCLYSILNAHGRLKRRRARCIRRHSRRGQASKARRISGGKKDRISRELSRLRKAFIRHSSHKNKMCGLSSCGPDWKPEVKEPQSEQGNSNELKDIHAFISETYGVCPEDWGTPDSEEEVSEGNYEHHVWNPVCARRYPKPERERYLIMMKLSRMHKNVLYCPEVPNGLMAHTAAALSDAIRFLEEALNTTSCCFEDKPYSLGMESYHVFECDLSDAELQLVKEHVDLAHIQKIIPWEDEMFC